jgi:uncharacterized membrane protein YhaH (DUF805 family)
MQRPGSLRPGQRIDFVPLDGAAKEIVVLSAEATQVELPNDILSLWQNFERCVRSKYIDANGRANRKEFWSFVLFQVVLILAASLLTAVFAAVLEPLGMLFAVGLVVIVLGLIIPGIAVSIRRLHDVGLSGWLYLITLIPYIGWLFIVVVGFIPSQDHANQYGPRPEPDGSVAQTFA